MNASGFGGLVQFRVTHCRYGIFLSETPGDGGSAGRAYCRSGEGSGKARVGRDEVDGKPGTSKGPRGWIASLRVCGRHVPERAQPDMRDRPPRSPTPHAMTRAHRPGERPQPDMRGPSAALPPHLTP